MAKNGKTPRLNGQTAKDDLTQDKDKGNNLAERVNDEGDRQERKPQNLLHWLRQNLQQLSATERQVGEYLLQQPHEALRLPIDQLAREIGVSHGTLSNFCQALGFSGFREFRLALAAEVNSPYQLLHTPIAKGDTLQAIANKAISANVDALLTILKTLDMGELERAIEAIQQARRIELFAVGISSVVALNATTRFSSTGLKTTWQPDVANQIATASFMSSQDVAMAISYAGEMRPSIKALGLAHEFGATTILLTGNPHSPMARYADIKLVVTPREPTSLSRNLRVAACTAMTGVIDIIFLGLLNSVDEAGQERINNAYKLYSHLNLDEQN